MVHGERVLTESTAIMEYVDEVFPGPRLMPEDPRDRWRVRWWMKFMDQWLGPSFSMIGAAAGILEKIGSVDLRARWQQITAGQFSAEQLADSRSKILQAVERIEERLADREWLMGVFSIADLESFAWLAGMVALVPEAFAARARTAAWLARVRATPAVARSLALARSADPATSWSVGPEINRWG